MANSKQLLKNVETNADLLSYSINISPILSQELDLPVQGEGIEKYGDLIWNNERNRNAFINSVNVIAKTVLVRSFFKNPLSFMFRGDITWGQTVQELFVGLTDIFDYNNMLHQIEAGTLSCADFACNVVPNVQQYLHNINFQKYYKTSTSDTQMAMAFTNGNDFFGVLDEIADSRWKSYIYDTFLIGKYILARCILNGLVASRQMPSDFTTPRQRAAYIQSIASLMTFITPEFNPAGAPISSDYSNLKVIIDVMQKSSFDVEVLSTSYFKNDAEFKMDVAPIDSFWNMNTSRLKEILGESFTEFTEEELNSLKSIQAVVVDERWFQFYNYPMDFTPDPDYNGNEIYSLIGRGRNASFFNPQTLVRNLWLHVWGIRDFSPLRPACVITTDDVSVISVTLNQSEVTVMKGQQIQLFADVVTTGFANKAVFWETDNDNVKINQSGVVKIPMNFNETTFTVTATSIFDKTKNVSATITVS